VIRYTYLIFFIILLTIIGSSPQVFADSHNIPPILAKTELSSYDNDDRVIVDGKIRDFDPDIHSDLELTYRVVDTTGNIVIIGKTLPNSDGTFSFNFVAGGSLFKLSGDYTIQLFFGAIKGEITMIFTGGEFTPAEPSGPQVSIDAHTNKSFYDYGDSVGVSGKIKNYDANIHSNLAVTYRVLDPRGELVTLGQTIPGSFGAFSFSFVARGNLFEPSGNYSIQIIFGSVQGEIPMFFSGGESEVPLDVTPPKILQPKDIQVYAKTHGGIMMINFDILVIDDTDKIIRPTCKPSSGYLFGIGETIVKCTARDSAGNFAIPVSFTVTVNPPETSIPSWVKNVAEFWCEDKIDDASFVEGIQYLIDNGIIVIPATTQSGNGSQEVPQWVKNNACWWSAGSITDEDFALGIEYLVKQGIIRV